MRHEAALTAAIVGGAIISSRLGYIPIINSQLVDTIAAQVKRLQRVQNSLARVIYRLPIDECILSHL